MATKTSGLKLVHKGLILSSIPLAFGIVFILAFESVMLDLRHYRNENDRAVSIASHLNNIQLSLFAEQGRYLDAASRDSSDSCLDWRRHNYDGRDCSN